MVGCWGNGSMYPIITTKQDFFLEYSIVLQAMTEVTVLRYTTDVIRQIMKEVPEISYEMIDHYCKFMNLFLYCITTQSFEPLTSRVCNILALYYQHFHDLLVPITQADLASLAGAKRESVVKVLRELREGGLIETHSGKIRILDMDALLAYMEGPARGGLQNKACVLCGAAAVSSRLLESIHHVTIKELHVVALKSG